MTLEEFVNTAVREAEPCAQNAAAGNLGFGWLYYAYVRNLRPRYAVVIGSRRGFSAFCAARGAQDNGSGHVFFIDPSYSGSGHPGWSGANLWADPEEVAARIARFELTGWMTHIKKTSADAFPIIRSSVGSHGLGFVLIDGAHTFENSLEDFELYSSLMRDGVILFHDSTSRGCDVSKTIDALKARGLPTVTLHREVGLTAVEIFVTRHPHPPKRSAKQAWGYLAAPSNRAERLIERVQHIVRSGDRVLDIYCGHSPLASGLPDVSIFGFDADRELIYDLREAWPQHTWGVIDERDVLATTLPNRIDVLVGLGVTRGLAPWDPKRVIEVVWYCLGRYHPRACIFETAEEYDDAAILVEIQSALEGSGYDCETLALETNMAAFNRRKLLLATLQ